MGTEQVTVGLLHPGSMGAAVAAQLRRAETNVLWSPAGRSPATAARAEAAGLEAANGLADLVERSDIVLSLCPPAAAEEVARQVAARSCSGKVYVEANAISPTRMRRIAGLLPQAVVIDAAVVGSPPVGGKQPRLYASGPSCELVRLGELFAATDLRFRPLGEEIGRASALKLSYSSYQKASRVLAAVSYALADANGVAEELLDIAGQRRGSYLTETDYIAKTAARAWRWAPELEEAAELLEEAGLPDDLMRAAAAVLSRWSSTRDADLGITEALTNLSNAPSPVARQQDPHAGQ